MLCEEYIRRCCKQLISRAAHHGPWRSGFTSTLGAEGCSPCLEGTFHGDGWQLAPGGTYGSRGMRNASGGTGAMEASVVDLAEITGIVSTAGIEYTVLPNTCIACPRNTYQPLKAQAATGSLGLAAFSACRWGRWGGVGWGGVGGARVRAVGEEGVLCWWRGCEWSWSALPGEGEGGPPSREATSSFWAGAAVRWHER